MTGLKAGGCCCTSVILTCGKLDNTRDDDHDQCYYLGHSEDALDTCCPLHIDTVDKCQNG